MTVTVTAAPLPSNFVGTPQQLIEALLDRLEVTVDGSSFVVGDVQPSGNQGPWLKDGTQWWVWDEDTSTYIPLDVSASVNQQIFIGDLAAGAPDPTKYSLWLQLSGTTVNGLFYYAGTSAGWVRQPNELVAGVITLDKLASQNAGSLITFDVNNKPTLLPPGQPGQWLQSTGNGLAYATPNKSGPNFLASPIIIAKIEQNQGSITWMGAMPDASATVSSSRTAVSPADGWYNFSLAGTTIPLGITALIIEASSNTFWPDGYDQSPWYVFARDNSSSTNSYPLLRTALGYGGGAGQVAHSQGIFPVGLSGSFQWCVIGGGSVTVPNHGLFIRIIGYVV